MFLFPYTSVHVSHPSEIKKKNRSKNVNEHCYAEFDVYTKNKDVKNAFYLFYIKFLLSSELFQMDEFSHGQCSTQLKIIGVV